VVIRTRNNGSMTWKVIASHEPPDDIPEKDHRAYGLKEFKLEHLKKSAGILNFLMLLFKDWKEKVVKMNEAVVASKAKCKLFSQKEFLVGLAVLIGAAELAQRGCDLFSIKDMLTEESEDKNEAWKSLCAGPHFERFISFRRWKEFRRFFP
jgi:hypothetical protein